MSFYPRAVDLSSVEEASVLASWCDSPCHLVIPPAEQVISASPSASQSQPENEFTIDPQAQQQDLVSGGRIGPLRRRSISREEVAQRSVNFLLTEYRKMVKDQTRQPLYDAPAKGLSRVFLAFCPQLPAGFDLRGIVQLMKSSLHVTATLVEKMPVVLVPAWLWLCRLFLRQGSILLLLVAMVFGIAVFMTYESLLKQRTQTASLLSSRPIQYGQSALIEGPKAPQPMCGTVLSSSVSLGKVPFSSPSGKLTATTGSTPTKPAFSAAKASPAAVPGSPTVPQLQRLVVEVQALQRQVYGKESPVASSKEAVSAAIGTMCKELGHEYKAEFCTTYERLLEKMQELRRTVGV